MADHTTARRGLPYPDSTGKVGGPTGVGSVDTKELAEAMDVLDEGYASLLSPGLATVAEWKFGAFEVVGGTGEVKSEKSAGGVAWLPDPTVAGAMIRTVTPAKRLEIKPGTLPASGKYMAILFEFKPPTKYGDPVTYALTSRTEKATQAEAEATVPATAVTAGNLLYSWCVLKNTAGTYSIAASGNYYPALTSGSFTYQGGSWAVLAGPAAPAGPLATLGPVINLGEQTIPNPSGETLAAEPHPLRPVFVTVRLRCAGGFDYKAKLKLKEPRFPNAWNVVAEAGFRYLGGIGRMTKTFAFVCPPAVQWRVFAEVEGAETVNVYPSYVVL